MDKTKNTPTYKQKTNKSDMMRYFKAVMLPLGVFLFGLFTISRFANFGTYLIAPLTGVTWVWGVLCAALLPSHKKSILTETHATIAIYLLSLTGLRELISLISGVSSEMLMAAFQQAIPLTGGSAISGWLQTLLWITAVLTPFGFIVMQGKKLYSLKRKNNTRQVLAQLRNIRNDNHIHTN